MRKPQVIALALALASTLGAMSAHAHGEEEHAHAGSFDASKVEETDFGRQGDPRKVSQTIKVDMSDSMRFSPDTITIKRGETVRFVIHNSGKALHEMVLGTTQALNEHAQLMKKFPTMEHAEPSMAHVNPGKTGEIIWQFSRPGEFQFACLQPGHYEAGMLGKLVVRAESSAGEIATTEGEVRKVDEQQGKVTLKHGRIENLDMPAMTMVFKVADPKMLGGLKPRDKVRFAATNVNGALTVTAIEVVNY